MEITGRKKNVLCIFSLLLFTGIAITIYFFNPYYWYLENHYSKMYDFRHPQKNVTTKAEIESILKNFKQISYPELNKAYKLYSQSDEKKYEMILQSKVYYIIKGEDIFRFLVGKFRVKDFLAKDDYYWDNLKNLGDEKIQYLLIDKELLYKLLELQNKLELMGYDKNAFTINYAHRHPLLNEGVGGASVSYHIRGQAIDLLIGDINKDGISTKEDKQIVLTLLDNEIIKDKGGIGRYPWSSVLHFDVRGYKARWDKQK